MNLNDISPKGAESLLDALLLTEKQEASTRLAKLLEQESELIAWLGSLDIGTIQLAEMIVRDFPSEAVNPAGLNPAVRRLVQTAKLVLRSHQLETEFAQQLETAKLAGLRQLAYGAGHEINNPLANISIRAQTLLQDERDPERRRKLATIHTQALRAFEMIADMMLFARPPVSVPVEADLRGIVSVAVKEIAPLADERGTRLIQLGDDCPLAIQVDPQQITVAVKAMLTNAVEALGTGGQIEIEVRQVSGAGKPQAEIVVRDNGPGFSDEVRGHLFDPFYSGREAGRGLGFGLSKAWRIVEQHSGTIEVESELGHGARFTIKLPIV